MATAMTGYVLQMRGTIGTLYDYGFQPIPFVYYVSVQGERAHSRAGFSRSPCCCACLVILTRRLCICLCAHP